jgi:hypothetical protein
MVVGLFSGLARQVVELEEAMPQNGADDGIATYHFDLRVERSCDEEDVRVDEGAMPRQRG